MSWFERVHRRRKVAVMSDIPAAPVVNNADCHYSAAVWAEWRRGLELLHLCFHCHHRNEPTLVAAGWEPTLRPGPRS